MFLGGLKMKDKEEDLIERLIKENDQFRKAKELHSELARQLDEMEQKPYLTPQDEIDIKVLKKRKLASKDQMEKILLQFR